MKFLLLSLAFAAGMLAPIQAGMNAKLGRALGDSFYAALISFVVGTLGLLLYGLVGRIDFSTIRHTGDLHWTIWFAGLLGAFYVTSTIILTPRLGATLTFTLVIAGQLAMAVLMDHFGWFGIQAQPFNWLRFAGVVLVTAGVVLIRKF
ncbi:MAG: DMT family transporter [Proteobacteria bacterium]|nr:DMT family transporter [Pseudomonadota bacterium]MBU1387049.1 DMT family transporter [Pseudomonadota bacterium]MBU1542270.1 DMT family transporter [Pseudomonadota bacterium]MBU2430847.1 DMT family transporter [Pseudomonadota bacterium]MBU2481509.1 DMT family transporter [Pseudomonadota bacterium]